jgi:hypothetical protein
MLHSPHDHDLVELEISAGTPVFTVNGDKVGRVTHSALHEDYFMMEQGWLWSHTLFLPRRVIHLREARGITLTLSKDDLRLERWKTPPLMHPSDEASRPFFPPRPPVASPGPTDQGVVQPPSASPQGPERLTLQASLEAVAGLGEGYLLTGTGEEWTAGELLYWCQRHQPQSLHLPVCLVRPEANSKGAIYVVDLHGGVQSAVPVFRIERR